MFGSERVKPRTSKRARNEGCSSSDLAIGREGRGQINDDDSVNFYFRSEHHLLTVLEKQPYNYRGWIVALDRWSNRDSPTFIKQIPFKVRIYKLPDIYRRQGIVFSIGSRLGQVGEVSIIEPRNNREAKVWVNILFDVDDVITL